MFKNIKVLVWDFDGTLYPPNRQLWQAVRQAEYKTIMTYTGWDKDKVVAEFNKLHQKRIPSATETVAYLSGITTAQAAVEMEQYFDRRQFLKRDVKLIKLFAQLTGFRHVTLANGVIERHIQTLKVLGLPKETFELMVTSEVVGVTKPHDKGFRYILYYTKLPPEEHLMIGDREIVDLAPAKKLGMKTCLVWSQERSKIADVTLPTVYQIAKLLL